MITTDTMKYIPYRIGARYSNFTYSLKIISTTFFYKCLNSNEVHPWTGSFIFCLCVEYNSLSSDTLKWHQHQHHPRRIRVNASFLSFWQYVASSRFLIIWPRTFDPVHFTCVLCNALSPNTLKRTPKLSESRRIPEEVGFFRLDDVSAEDIFGFFDL